LQCTKQYWSIQLAVLRLLCDRRLLVERKPAIRTSLDTLASNTPRRIQNAGPKRPVQQAPPTASPLTAPKTVHQFAPPPPPGHLMATGGNRKVQVRSKQNYTLRRGTWHKAQPARLERRRPRPATRDAQSEMGGRDHGKVGEALSHEGGSLQRDHGPALVSNRPDGKSMGTSRGWLAAQVAGGQ
jgi:hypothetical protein